MKNSAFIKLLAAQVLFCLPAICWAEPHAHQHAHGEAFNDKDIELCKYHTSTTGEGPILAELSPPIDMNAEDEPTPRFTIGLAAAPRSGATFQLHSNPSAPKKLFLDFDGHTVTGTIWNSAYNSGNDIHAPAFSTDSDINSFSSTELARIEEIWKRVSEDFAPYNVDVTTEDPGVSAFQAGGLALRVMISTDKDEASLGGTGNQWYSGAGGVAYYNSWYWNSDTPVWVFENNLGNGNEKYVTEAISHEIGHAFGLAHDGTASVGYYQGHGSGETGWAPIMGVGYYRALSQWSKGEYSGANNTEDDLLKIKNALGYRTDDHGNSNGAATNLTVSGNTVSGSGIISETTDIDVFRFTTGGGSVTITVNPYDVSDGKANLDVLAKLFNSAGSQIASSNPTEQVAATISLSLAAGTYFLHVDGTGKGSPSTGYSDYGSLGQYTITGTVPAGSGGDTSNPTATLLSSPDVTAEGATSYDFTVRYADNVAVDVSTLSLGDARVVGPSSYNVGASFVGVDNNSNGTPRTATYRITPPGGSWNSADNGTYTILMQSSQVFDTSVNPVPNGTLGTFTVNVQDDSDGDGIPNTSDNCPNTPNAGQQNFDGDSQGDACDLDDDNDGTRDVLDCAPFDASKWRNRAFPDGDNDGVRNATGSQSVSCYGSTAPSGYTANQNGPDNCPTVPNSGQENYDYDAQGDACDADDDNDGLLDTSESDGSCPFRLDPDSDDDGSLDSTDPQPCIPDEEPQLGNRICAEWNGFLGDTLTGDGMFNILEVQRATSVGSGGSSAPINVLVTLFKQSGAAQGQLGFSLALGEKRDVLVHGLTGFAPLEVGLVCLQHNGQPGDVDGAMIHYNFRRAWYDFAIASAFSPGKYGRQVVPFNTYHPGLAARLEDNDPDDAGQPVLQDRVANWLQVSYFPVQGDTRVFNGTLSIYDMNGDLLQDPQGNPAQFLVTLNPGERRDYSGHVYGHSRVGIAVLEPHANSVDILVAFGNNRYFYKKHFAINTFDTAFRVESLKATTEVTAVSLDTRNGASAIVEIMNPNTLSAAARVDVYDEFGTFMGQVTLSEAQLTPKASFHVITDAILGANRRGVAFITPLVRSVASVGMEYHRDNRGVLEVASSTPAVPISSNVIGAGYNSYLQQLSEAVVINYTAVAQLTTYDVLDQSGNVLFGGLPLGIPAHGIAVVRLTDFVAPNVYGGFVLNVPNDGGGKPALSARMRRIRTSDWVLSLPVRE